MESPRCYCDNLKVTDFSYELPPDLIAQEPLADRSASRMLLIDRATGTWKDGYFRDLPLYLGRGDCLVLNDSRVMPSRLFGHRAGGTGTVEVLFLKPLSTDRRTWQVLVRPGRRLHEGSVVEFDDSLGGVILDTGERGERKMKLLGAGDIDEVLQRIGHMPLPPYIRRDDTAQDRERYQTVYSQEPGSAAAPTAGLHFTPRILDECQQAGADIARITLHVGLGTFSPLHTDEVKSVHLHSERYRIDGPQAAKIAAAKRRVAVGTTSVRTLETWGQRDELAGETDIFIYPGHQFKLVDAMLTNFHLPESSLMLLVCAFGGTELMLDAYRHAVRERYRFFSYGDCMLIV